MWAFQDLQDEVDLLPTKAYVDWQDNLKANVTDVYDKDTMDQLLADKAHVTHTHTTAEVTWLATQLATHTADIAALDTRVDALEADMADIKDDILDVNKLKKTTQLHLKTFNLLISLVKQSHLLL